MKITRSTLFVGLLAAVAGFVLSPPAQAAEKLSLLLVDGQNNHDWRATSPVLKDFLGKTGRFTVDVATSPPKKSPAAAWDAFRPDFSKYQVVLSNYNGELWPEPVQKGLEAFVAGGGGLVIVHAANNAFPSWVEWNKMIGLGWRGASYGDRLTLDAAGKLVRTAKGEGPGAGHGPQHAFPIVIRDRTHPVMKGMPAEWMHHKDELYHGQRGPALNMYILATAYSAPDKRGTDAHEPMIWWIPYGKGRVFTTVMGHADYSMQCIGFQSVVARGCEWAAGSKVTLAIPKNFPKPDEVSLAGADK